MFVIVGVKYVTETARGSTTKVLTCEHCGCQYGYRMNVSTKGASASLVGLGNAGTLLLGFHKSGRRQAAEKAAARLIDAFERECLPVSCPDCGCYQANMLRVMRERRAAIVGAIVLVPTLLLCAFLTRFFPQLESIDNRSVDGMRVGIVIMGVVVFTLLRGKDYNADARERVQPITSDQGSAGQAERVGSGSRTLGS